MKLLRDHRRISPFGGINFVISLVTKAKLPELVDGFFCPRVKQAKYSYSEFILGWVYCMFCGAGRLEDVMGKKGYLETRSGFRLPSSDRLSQVFRNFATANTKLRGPTGKTYLFNVNFPLNRLMLKVALKLGELSPKRKGYILDYDNTIISTEKYESTYTMFKRKGFQPGVAFIGKTPVYIENRSGSAGASFRIAETVGRAFSLLEENNINIKWLRSDAGGYVHELINLAEKKGVYYIIRASTTRWLLEDLNLEREWAPVVTGNGGYLEAFNKYNEGRGRRYIVFRSKSRKVVGKCTKGAYHYFALVTNNDEITPLEAYRLYINRGAIELNFMYLKNDFNWSRLPFSFLNENTVFMVFSAIACIIYNYCIKVFSKKAGFVKKTFRLKNFISNFIAVPAWFEDGNLVLDTRQKGYEVLLE